MSTTRRTADAAFDESNTQQYTPNRQLVGALFPIGRCPIPKRFYSPHRAYYLILMVYQSTRYPVQSTEYKFKKAGKNKQKCPKL